jgi:hypothetical protein
MRKAILALVLVLLPLAAACQRSRDVIDQVPAGSQLTLTRHDGQAVTGRLVETRADALVIRTADGSPATVARKDIASVTIATPAAARGESATPTATPAPPPGGSQATGTPGAAPVESEPLAPLPAATGAGAAAAGRPAPAWREIVVPAGTQLEIRLDEAVASDTSRVEEPVRATLVDEIAVHGVTAVPAGSAVTGSVTRARRSGRVKGVAELAIRFDSVKPAGGDARYRLRTGLVTRRAAKTRKKDALSIAAPAAGGAILGGLLGGKKGALIGTTVGAGAGTAVVLSTRGKEVRLPRGAILAIKLLEPVTVRVPA